MPDGAGTMIGPLGLRLSGGQIQRAGAARALVRSPLAAGGGRPVERAGRRDRGTPVGARRRWGVRHRAAGQPPTQVLERADKVVVLDSGRVVETLEPTAALPLEVAEA